MRPTLHHRAPGGSHFPRPHYRVYIRTEKCEHQSAPPVAIVAKAERSFCLLAVRSKWSYCKLTKLTNNSRVLPQGISQLLAQWYATCLQQAKRALHTRQKARGRAETLLQQETLPRLNSHIYPVMWTEEWPPPKLHGRASDPPCEGLRFGPCWWQLSYLLVYFYFIRFTLQLLL